MSTFLKILPLCVLCGFTPTLSSAAETGGEDAGVTKLIKKLNPDAERIIVDGRAGDWRDISASELSASPATPP